MEKRLSERQKAFVREYLVDLNASAAAVRAGYSKRCCAQVGHRLLLQTNVAAAVREALDRRAREAEDSAAAVLRDLLDLYRRALGDSDYRAAVKALELRGRHLGMFGARLEVTGRDGGAIQHVHDLARQVVEDAGAADLAHELLERVAGHAGRSRLDSLPGLLDPGPAPAPAEQAPD